MSKDSDSGEAVFRLHEFLRHQNADIFDGWEQTVRQVLNSAERLSSQELRNNLPDILEAIAKNAEIAGGQAHKASSPSAWPKHHAQQRWSLGFSLEEVTREYSLLRDIVLQKLISDEVGFMSAELVLLNAAIDEAIIQAVINYVASSNQALEDERERLEVTVMSIGDGVVSTDAVGRITDLNPAAEKMSGWPRSEALGRNINDVLVSLDESAHQPMPCLSEADIESEEVSKPSTNILLQSRDGTLTPSEQIAAHLRSSSGAFLGFVVTVRDVTEVRALTSQLGHLATHDVLTKLPNRALIADRLHHGLAHANREDSRLAVLFLDLDLFKEINDSLGHDAGDQLLKQVADRLKVHTRRSDTVGRLGGDEFVILLSEVHTTDFLSEFCTNLVEALCAPYVLGVNTVEVSSSIGVSVFPDDADNAETLMQYADVAMYQAKELGRNNIQFFKPAMNKRARAHREMQEELQNAITLGQLSLHYQPQVSLSSGNLIGAEALLRWRHPEFGWVAPDDFIPVAEENKSTIVTIGNWVLNQVCQQLRVWIDNGHDPVPISLNISLAQLRDDRFLDHIEKALKEFQLPPSLLQLELIEAVLLCDVQRASNRIRALGELGVKIAVDNFGTGYSSLRYLQELAVNEVKIDRSFTRIKGPGSNEAAIVQAIICMGRNLNLRVIAEGVESEDEADFLKANGCEGAQGHYYSAAIGSEAFESQFLNSSASA